MSWTCDDVELVAGGWLTSAYAGHGILAQDIPSTGDHGASVLYDQVALPGDNDKEVRAEILTAPIGLTTWYQDEDGSVTASGPDGAYSYTIQVSVDGIALGSAKTVTLSFGVGSSSVDMIGALGALSASAASSAVSLAALQGLEGSLSASAASAIQAAATFISLPGSLNADVGSNASCIAAIVSSVGNLNATASAGAMSNSTSKYLQLQKLKTDLSGTSTFIINREDILLVDNQPLQNKVTQAIEVVSRVVLAGYPSYTFYTRTLFSAFETKLKTVDFTGGVGAGSSCTVPGVLDIVTVSPTYPTVKIYRVKNNTTLLTEPYIVNLNYLYFAEEVPFVDEELNTQVTAFMLTLKGNPHERFLAKITLAELQAALDPTII